MRTSTILGILWMASWGRATVASAADVRPTFGAIRWDGWFEGNPWQRNLDPQRWHARVPFYGRVISDDRVEVCGDSQDAMDREIAYASAAGLDYWAFLHYHPASWDGADKYNYGLRRYLASVRKAELKFCLIIYPVGGEEWARQVEFVASVVQEPSYQRVAAGRPLVYLLTWGDGSMPEEIWGAAEKSRAAVDLLRKRIRDVGMKDPYIVVQGMQAERSARYVAELGLDAISSYANWTGGSFADLAAVNRKFWEACRATGKATVPLVSLGWDPRPRKQAGGPQPAPEELRDHVRSALEWARSHREIAPAQTIIAYAWNESDEGGWLVPTQGEGTTRLDAVRDALAPPGEATGGTLVGVSYFAGWWKPLPNKWNYDPEAGDWRPEFPERVPLLGEYNDQETMDREIVAAAEHGVDFFLILWYYNGPGDTQEREPNARCLNEGVKTFVRSREAHRMRFAIEYCNHPPYEVRTQEDWSHCVKMWLDAMRHPSYLRVGGRLVFKVHSWYRFWGENRKDPESCRARLAFLRDEARKLALGELVIGCGVGAGEAIGAGHPAAEGFEFTGTYMDLPPLARTAADHPYEKLCELSRSSRELHAKDKIPYLPYLGAGFHAEPWPDERARFFMPTREEWVQELRRVKLDLDRRENLGLPLADGRRRKAFSIYAWNEFGEGGFVAPTKGEGYMKLQAIREVFGGPASPR